PAGAADAILSQADIPLTINTVKSRPEFSTFGQTPWSTSLQAKFAANLCLVPGSSEIVNLMAQIIPDQSYGLGTLPGSRFKGGWGPTPQGAYQVRQFGLATAPHGDVAVALTTSPASGQYSDAQAMATMIARELSVFLDRLPATSCGR
ncbi:MAG: hypothetical protein SOW59_07150, partial [Corynebacterium sp.]|nr:hypothetical protein [Corynebacterium sp.]